MCRWPARLLLIIAACGGSDGAGDGGAGGDGATFDGLVAIDGAPPADAWPRTDPLDGAGSATAVDTGYMFLEGPVWRAADQVLLFSDIPANTIYRLSPPDSIDVFRADSGNSNGLAEDRDGLLLAAEHGNRRVSRTLGNGDVVDVATMFEGMRLNSPNDIAVRSDGTVYFTDPPYGIAPQDQELAFNGVFRVAPNGALTAEWQGGLQSRPNGIGLSPDESTLYVSDTAGPVRAYDVAADGSLSNERMFAPQLGTADGLCLDVAGNVFVTSASGVQVFAPDGVQWGTITVPEGPANCAFGGADRRTLYVTAQTGLYRVSMVVPGA